MRRVLQTQWTRMLGRSEGFFLPAYRSGDTGMITHHFGPMVGCLRRGDIMLSGDNTPGVRYGGGIEAGLVLKSRYHTLPSVIFKSCFRSAR